MQTSLFRQAVAAAYPFGGYALPFQEPVLDALVAKGRVEILCRDPLDGGVGCGLTERGRKLARRLKRGEA